MTKKFITNLPSISDAKKPEPLITKRAKIKPYPVRLTKEEHAMLNLKKEEMNRITIKSKAISKHDVFRAMILIGSKADAKTLLKAHIESYQT